MAQLFSNYAQSTLDAQLLIAGTTMTVPVTEGGVFQAPVGDDFELITLTDGTNWEVVKVTNRTGDSFTIERGHEGVARQWEVGALVKAQVTKATMENMIQRIVNGGALNMFKYKNFR